jgi:tripartite-type tricarboxylate transporter receptor subunit TctC
VEQARKNPGKLTYGSSGVSSFHHLMGEMLKQHGVDMVHVPYKGLAPAVTALAGGEIARALAAPEVNGKLRALYLNVIVTPPEQMPAFVARTSEAFGEIVKRAGIQATD